MKKLLEKIKSLFKKSQPKPEFVKNSSIVTVNVMSPDPVVVDSETAKKEFPETKAPTFKPKQKNPEVKDNTKSIPASKSTPAPKNISKNNTKSKK